MPIVINYPMNGGGIGFIAQFQVVHQACFPVCVLDEAGMLLALERPSFLHLGILGRFEYI